MNSIEEIRYLVNVELTDEEKRDMYMKLSKRELVAMLMQNQRLLDQLAPKDPVIYTPIPDIPLIWHGINHPLTGDPLGPTFQPDYSSL